jgi:cytochrome c-type biogenesis protein CcmE
MEERRERLQRLRVASLLAAIIVGLGLLLTQCPSNRDGMPGQLAQSMDETTTAARSGALALDLWIQRRSTNQLASVQLSDAREQVVKAYKGIADLRVEDQVDIGRQRMLTESMTAIIGQLNAAAATIRHVTNDPTAEKARDDLLASADALESGYR